MKKISVVLAMASLVVAMTGCSTLSEIWGSMQEQYAAQRKAEFDRVNALPPAGLVVSPQPGIAACGRLSCALFNEAQPKMKAYIAYTETSRAYTGYYNDVQALVKGGMTYADASKKELEIIMADDAKRSDDEKVYPQIQRALNAINVLGPQSIESQMYALSSRNADVFKKLGQIRKELAMRQKELDHARKHQQISEDAYVARTSEIQQRNSECNVIGNQLYDASQCVSFIREQYKRVGELERYATK